MGKLQLISARSIRVEEVKDFTVKMEDIAISFISGYIGTIVLC